MTSTQTQSISARVLPTLLLALVAGATTPALARKPGAAMWVDAVPKLSLRKAPANDGEKLGAIKYEQRVQWLEETGEPFEVDGRVGRWTKVAYGGQQGWVFGGLLQEYRLYPYKRGGRIGFLDREGSSVQSPRYSAAGEVTTSAALTAEEANGKWAVLGPRGKALAPARYKWAQPFSEGVTTAEQQDGTYWFLDTRGQPLASAPPGCMSVGSFRDGVAYCQKKARSGNPHDLFLDKKGAVVFRVPDPYFGGSEFREGLLRVTRKVGNKYRTSLLGKDGKAVFATGTDGFVHVGEASDGMAVVVKGDKYGFIDTTGSVVIEPRFDWVGPFQEGRAPFGRGKFVNDCRAPTPAIHWDHNCDSLIGKFGFIDKTGAVVVEPVYDVVHGFAGGFAAVATGEMVTQTESNPMDSYDYLAFKGKFGFINRAGKLWIKPSFREVRPFHNGLARVKKGRSWVYVNKWGKTVFEDAGAP